MTLHVSHATRLRAEIDAIAAPDAAAEAVGAGAGED